jgi:hypothetical protein
VLVDVVLSLPKQTQRPDLDPVSSVELVEAPRPDLDPVSSVELVEAPRPDLDPRPLSLHPL